MAIKGSAKSSTVKKSSTTKAKSTSKRATNTSSRKSADDTLKEAPPIESAAAQERPPPLPPSPPASPPPDHEQQQQQNTDEAIATTQPTLPNAPILAEATTAIASMSNTAKTVLDEADEEMEEVIGKPAAASSITPSDSPDADINHHIANLSVSESTTSPARKKSKKTSEGKGKSTKGTPKASTTDTAHPPTSILKGSKTPSTTPAHNHVFKRTVIEAAVMLEAEAEKDRYAEFKHALGIILTNMGLVDPTTIMEPLHPTTKMSPWSLPKHVPSNMTEVGKFVFISTNPWRFKVKGAKRSENVIYFSFTMSSDTPPADLCSAINMEWCRQNGERIAVKTVQTHDTVSPIAIFFLWNEGAPDLFLPELQKILTLCWEYGLATHDEFLPPTIAIPEIALKKQFPMVKGANTHVPPPPKGAHGPSPQVLQLMQAAKKVLHIEVGRKHADLLKYLVEIGKARSIFKAFWGEYCHPSEMLDADAPNEAKDALIRMSQNHQMFIFGSRVERLIGITNLDRKVEIKKSDGTTEAMFSLRDILLNHLKTPGGKLVIDSAHQRGMDEPFAVVQNSGEIESIMLRLNHQLPAFLLHYLRDKNLPEDFLIDLLRKSCDPCLFADAFNCKWDPKDQVITRPDEEELRAKEAAQAESQKWYKDMINMHMITQHASPPKPQLPPEARFDISDQSVTTINVHKKKAANSSAQAHTNAKSTGDSDSSGDDDDNSDSASENATGKSFATVGFGKNTSAIDMTGESSDDEGSSTASGSDVQGSVVGGKSG